MPCNYSEDDKLTGLSSALAFPTIEELQPVHGQE